MEKAMSSEELKPLLEEYKQLFSYVNSNALICLNIPPAILAVATGLAVYSKETPPLFGLGVSLAIFIMLVWLGYCHSMVNGIGLKLVEIEQKINHCMKRSDCDGLSFHSWYIAQGAKVLPGFHFYSILLGLTFGVILFGAIAHFWLTMTGWSCSVYTKLCGVTVLAALNLAALGNMVQAERKTYKQKQEIINRYVQLNKGTHTDKK